MVIIMIITIVIEVKSFLFSVYSMLVIILTEQN